MSARGERASASGRPVSLYVPVAPLASGGMGSVELVLRREGDFRRLYARKRPHAGHDRADSFRAHFLREARVAGLLRHPNVVSVLDVGEDASGPFLVMDFVEGIPLSTLIRRFRARGELIPLQVCLAIARQVADGLHAAHELRDHDGAPVALVHRDVSPQNVLLDYDGVARVTDFGLAKALGAGAQESSSDALKGKVGYMAPEQLRFEPLDRRSDLWALGVVLYELLACERLYPGGGEGIERVARQILDDAPPDAGALRDDVPPSLTELVFDLLAKDREERPPTAAVVARRLGEILREVEATDGVIELADFVAEHFGEDRAEARDRRSALIAAAERRDVEPAREPGRRLGWLAALAAAVALVTAAGWGAWALRDDDPPAPSVTEAASSAAEPTAPPAAEPPAPEARAEAVEEIEAVEPEAEVEPPAADAPEPEPDPRATPRRRGRGARDRLWEWP
ncbi:MAG: serine/threonine protein kinase [Sandaracinaceae bacterium]|nr:serine/threonine protein kinase [Sandaracinaceae bacterium]